MDWDLIGWSFRVIRRNKQLLIFPALSTVAALTAMALFAVARFGGIADLAEQPFGWADYLWGVAALFVVSCVAIFFNCALAACAQAYFSGEQPTISQGIEHAAARLPRILAWAALSTTVGLLLDAIERRVSFFGKVTTWIFGFAWAAATYLVVPVLIAEDRSALGSLRRAAELGRKTWTDQIVAQLRFTWRTLLMLLPAIVLFVIGLNGYPIALPAAVAYGAVCVSAISAAQGVFEVALYRYSALGETPREWPARLTGILR